MRTFTIQLLLLVLLTTQSILAQKGKIEGIVIDQKSGLTMIGSTVIIDGTTFGTTTDINGMFVLNNVDPGVYRLKVSFVSYKTVFVDGVTVEAGKSSIINTVGLEENMVSAGDITISAVRKTNTDMSVISIIRNAPNVASGISSQQISRTLDKDASEVIRRIPGITIQDDRFLIVRGLSQRYNNVWLNNSATPSSEADVKAFSFDVIPSSMIESLIIYKASAADLPADFSGGFVKLSTKAMPNENSIFVSYGTGISESTTFQSFLMPPTGPTDLMGFDNGSRALPSTMPAHLNLYESATNPIIRAKISSLGQALDNRWSPSIATAIPDQKLSFGIARRFDALGVTFGNTTALSYSHSNSSTNLQINDYSIYDFGSDKPVYLNQFTDNQNSISSKITLMHNWTMLLKTGKIEFRNLLNQSGNNRYNSRTGQEWYNDGRFIKSNELRYYSRTTYSGQLAGSHRFGDGNSLAELALGYALSGKNEPDTKRYRYLMDPSDPDYYIMLFNDQADLSSQSRMWIDLAENTLSASLSFTRKTNFFGNQGEFKTGLYAEDKSRAFNARNFGYSKSSSLSNFGQTRLPIDEVFVDSNLNSTTGIKLVEVTSLSDSYTASNKHIAGYLSVTIPFTKSISLYTGLRVEKNNQSLASYKQGSVTEVNVSRDTINFFPSTNLTVNLNQKSLIRAAYGMSVNRPEFREIAPFYYVDFEMNAGIYGAPHIKQAYIHNFDIRYEFYPEYGEMFTFGAFYKRFTNPIEQVILGNSPTQYSFENVKSAYSYGLEAELRKSLDFLPVMSKFTLVANGSLVTSRVQFPYGSLSRNRPMEGQSPYIVNAGIFYNDERNMSISLMYNIIGKRIVAVGRPSPNEWEDIPNINEMPRNLLDLTISKTIGQNIEIKGGIKDILDQPVKYVQTIDTMVDMNIYQSGTDNGLEHFTRDQTTRLFKPGRYFSLSVTVKL